MAATHPHQCEHIKTRLKLTALLPKGEYQYRIRKTWFIIGFWWIRGMTDTLSGCFADIILNVKRPCSCYHPGVVMFRWFWSCFCSRLVNTRVNFIQQTLVYVNTLEFVLCFTRVLNRLCYHFNVCYRYTKVEACDCSVLMYCCSHSAVIKWKSVLNIKHTNYQIHNKCIQ